MDRAKWAEEFSKSDYNGGVCDVLVTYNDGIKPYFMQGEVCHMCMVSVHGKNIDYVYSSCRLFSEEYRDDAEEYWAYLFSDQSPYRGALKDVDILKNEKGHTVAVGIKNNGAPNQLCVGVMIQARIPSEWPARLKSYRIFRKAGYDPAHAMFLSEHFYVYDAKRLAKQINNGGWHSSFDANMICYNRFMNGEPDPKVLIPGHNWMNNVGDYAPIIHMWGRPVNGVLNAFGNQKKFNGLLTGYFQKYNGSIYHDKGVAETPIEEALAKIKDYPKEMWL